MLGTTAIIQVIKFNAGSVPYTTAIIQAIKFNAGSVPCTTAIIQVIKANERKKVRQLIRCQGTNKDEIFFKIGQTFKAMFKQSHSLLG